MKTSDDYKLGFLSKCAELGVPRHAAEGLLKLAEGGNSDPNLQRASEIFEDWLTNRRHTVQRGEVLSGIARKYNIPLQEIQEANGLNTTFLKPGQTLRIPMQSKEQKQQASGKTLTKASSASPASNVFYNLYDANTNKQLRDQGFTKGEMDSMGLNQPRSRIKDLPDAERIPIVEGFDKGRYRGIGGPTEREINLARDVGGTGGTAQPAANPSSPNSSSPNPVKAPNPAKGVNVAGWFNRQLRSAGDWWAARAANNGALRNYGWFYTPSLMRRYYDNQARDMYRRSYKVMSSNLRAYPSSLVNTAYQRGVKGNLNFGSGGRRR